MSRRAEGAAVGYDPRVMSLLRLPNGMEIACQSATEAHFLYRDIFEREVYCRHGISLEDAECVFDVGANVGLFTLFVHRRRPRATIFAVEPAPPLAEILRFNVERFGVAAEIFDCGLSDAAGSARLTFYPRSPGMSSFYADPEEERRALHRLMVNQWKSGEPGMEEVMEHAGELLDERLQSTTFDCPLRTLSDIIRERRVRRIDLLKIDVQKSELDVLEGIAEEHWPRIRQVVLELHDEGGRFQGLRRDLEARGFQVSAGQDDAYRDSVMLNVYARRDVPCVTGAASEIRRPALEPARRRAMRIQASRRRPGRPRDGRGGS